MKRIKLLLAAVLVAPLLVTGVASAQPDPQTALCEGGDNLTLNEAGNAAIGDCATGTITGANTNVNSLLTDIINIFSVVVGIIAVIMIIVGGFKYITSGGDSGNVTGAKNTILYAVIGLIIVALAQLIVRFVLNRATVADA